VHRAAERCGPGVGLGADCGPSSVLFILDASGSMWEPMKSRTKIDIGREVVRDDVAGILPAEIPIELMAYGHDRKGKFDVSRRTR